MRWLILLLVLLLCTSIAFAGKGSDGPPVYAFKPSFDPGPCDGVYWEDKDGRLICDKTTLVRGLGSNFGTYSLFTYILVCEVGSRTFGFSDNTVSNSKILRLTDPWGDTDPEIFSIDKQLYRGIYKLELEVSGPGAGSNGQVGYTYNDDVLSDVSLSSAIAQGRILGASPDKKALQRQLLAECTSSCNDVQVDALYSKCGGRESVIVDGENFVGGETKELIISANEGACGMHSRISATCEVDGNLSVNGQKGQVGVVYQDTYLTQGKIIQTEGTIGDWSNVAVYEASSNRDIIVEYGCFLNPYIADCLGSCRDAPDQVFCEPDSDELMCNQFLGVDELCYELEPEAQRNIVLLNISCEDTGHPCEFSVDPDAYFNDSVLENGSIYVDITTDFSSYDPVFFEQGVANTTLLSTLGVLDNITYFEENITLSYTGSTIEFSGFRQQFDNLSSFNNQTNETTYFTNITNLDMTIPFSLGVVTQESRVLVDDLATPAIDCSGNPCLMNLDINDYFDLDDLAEGELELRYGSTVFNNYDVVTMTYGVPFSGSDSKATSQDTENAQIEYDGDSRISVTMTGQRSVAGARGVRRLQDRSVSGSINSIRFVGSTGVSYEICTQGFRVAETDWLDGIEVCCGDDPFDAGILAQTDDGYYLCGITDETNQGKVFRWVDSTNEGDVVQISGGRFANDFEVYTNGIDFISCQFDMGLPILGDGDVGNIRKAGTQFQHNYLCTQGNFSECTGTPGNSINQFSEYTGAPRKAGQNSDSIPLKDYRVISPQPSAEGITISSVIYDSGVLSFNVDRQADFESEVGFSIEVDQDLSGFAALLIPVRYDTVFGADLIINDQRIPNILNYTTGSYQPGEWRLLRIPIDISQVDNMSIIIPTSYANNYFGDQVFVGQIEFGDFMVEGRGSFCTEYTVSGTTNIDRYDWIADLDEDAGQQNGKEACEAQGLSWTGTSCCGDDGSPGQLEFYTDTEASCFAGQPITGVTAVDWVTIDGQRYYYVCNELDGECEVALPVSNGGWVIQDFGYNVSLEEPLAWVDMRVRPPLTLAQFEEELLGCFL